MRGTKAPKRILNPDKIYNSVLVTKLINYVMKDGKKSIAEKLVYESLESFGKKVKANPLDALQQVLTNITPRMEVKSRRVGGSNLVVPVPVTPERGQILSIRWILEITRKKTGKDFVTLFTQELESAYNNTGETVKKRENVEKMAESNKAFSQFRF